MANISYNKTNWVNGTTALNADNLNNIEMGVDNATKAINNKVDKVAGKGLSTNDFNDHYKNAIDNLQGECGISVIELTNKNGTIASTQLGEINANPQNFAFKYNGKILLFTSADSTTYQYCNNTTSSSDNNVMTTSTLLKITSSTGAYTIAENVHNVVANSIHPANGGDLTNIQVGSKVYSIPSGGESIPVIKGTVTSQTAEGTTITIPEVQSSNYVLNVLDMYYVYMDTIGTNGLGGGVLVAKTSPDTTMMQIMSYVGQGTNITKYESIYTLSTLFNDYKIFIEGQNSYDILPYDADTDTDEGKVLTVRNGDLVWETPSAGGSGSISVTFED